MPIVNQNNQIFYTMQNKSIGSGYIFFIMKDKKTNAIVRSELFEPFFNKPNARTSMEFYLRQNYKLMFRIVIKSINQYSLNQK